MVFLSLYMLSHGCCRLFVEPLLFGGSGTYDHLVLPLGQILEHILLEATEKIRSEELLEDRCVATLKVVRDRMDEVVVEVGVVA